MGRNIWSNPQRRDGWRQLAQELLIPCAVQASARGLPLAMGLELRVIIRFPQPAAD